MSNKTPLQNSSLVEMNDILKEMGINLKNARKELKKLKKTLIRWNDFLDAHVEDEQ